MVPFALLARRGCSTPCRLSLALAAEFARVQAQRADLALEELAAGLAGARAELPERQLEAVGELAGARLEAVALTNAIDDLLVDPAAGALRDARTLAEPVAWQCCHQVAARILNRIGARAERVGHVGWALRAAELRLALPFDGPTRERLHHDLRRVRARLN